MKLGQSLASRVAAATAVLVLGSLGAVAVSATPAQAAPECSKKEKFVTVTARKTPWVITDIHRFHNGSGKSVTITLTTKKQRQLSSSRTVTAGGAITLKAAIKALQGEGNLKLDFTLVKKKAKTKSTTFTRKTTVPAGKTILIYVARHQAKGTWTHYYCNGQRLSQLGRGTVKSYGTMVEDGLQRCDLKANEPAAKKAKKQFC